MTTGLLILVGLVIAAVIVASALRGPRGAGVKDAEGAGGGGAGEALPYRRREYVLTRAERVFFDALVGVLRHPTDPVGMPQMLVFPQVPLSCVLLVPSGGGSGEGKGGRQQWVNKIDRKRTDFVLVDTATNRTRLVIELDDSSHEREDRMERDGFVERALAAAGVPLLRVRVAGSYERGWLAGEIRRVLGEQGRPGGGGGQDAAAVGGAGKGAAR